MREFGEDYRRHDAQPAASIKILERGIYRAVTVGQRPAPDTTGIMRKHIAIARQSR